MNTTPPDDPTAVRLAAERQARFAEIAMRGTPSQAPAYRDAAYMEVYSGTPYSQMADQFIVARAYLSQRAELTGLRKELADVDDACSAIVRHTTPAECVGCGCVSMTTTERAAYLARDYEHLRMENAELARTINAPLWLVWSNEYRAWLGPDECNYYWSIESAGRYTLAEARKICGMRGVERGNGTNPPKLVQPSPELIAMWDAALARHDAGKGGGE